MATIIFAFNCPSKSIRLSIVNCCSGWTFFSSNTNGSTIGPFTSSQISSCKRCLGLFFLFCFFSFSPCGSPWTLPMETQIHTFSNLSKGEKFTCGKIISRLMIRFMTSLLMKSRHFKSHERTFLLFFANISFSTRQQPVKSVSTLDKVFASSFSVFQSIMNWYK